jgi:hypothetical protein
VSTHLEATLMVGPNAAANADAHVHAAGYRDDLTIGAIRVAGLCIQTTHETSPEDLAVFFDALAAKVRDAHAEFLVTNSNGDLP